MWAQSHLPSSEIHEAHSSLFKSLPFSPGRFPSEHHQYPRSSSPELQLFALTLPYLHLSPLVLLQESPSRSVSRAVNGENGGTGTGGDQSLGLPGPVNAPVPQECGADGEAPAAVGTGVRPLAGVGAAVLREVGALPEAVPAVGAGVRPLPAVHPPVPQQGRPPQEALPALRALEGALSGVQAAVLDEV